VGNDAIGFQGAPANTIDLEVINDAFVFDFDVLDITAVTQNNLLLVGDTNGARDLVDDVVVGNLDLIDDVNLFTNLWLTNASITSAGTEFVLDFGVGELQDDNSTLFTFDGTGINASLVTGSDLDISVVGGLNATIVGGAGADNITGGGGDDIITGGAGADVLDGGVATEVRQIELSGILDATVDAPVVTLTMGTGGLVLTLNESAAPADVDPTDETLDILAGSGSNAVGTSLATLVNANIADINAVVGAFTDGVNDVDLLSASFAAGLLTFTFASGADVIVGDAIVATVTDTGASFVASTDTTISDGGDGGADTFVFSLTAAANGVDTIVEFTDNPANLDILDFTAFLEAAAVVDTVAVDGAAADLNLTGETVGVMYGKAGLVATDIVTAGTAAFGQVILADNAKAVVLVSADADGVADATVNDYSIYYVEDTNTTTPGQTWSVNLVGTIDNSVELDALNLAAAGHFA
jgi:hypothetical protein